MLHSTEESMQDEPMPSPVEEYAYLKNFSIIHRMGIAYHMHQLKPYNISGHQMGYIAYISQHPGISQEQLSRFFRLNKATIAKGIRALEENGFILRQPSSADKRAYELYLTEKARGAIRDLERTTRTFVKTLLGGMSEEEQQTFKQLLLRAAENVTEDAPDAPDSCCGKHSGTKPEAKSGTKNK